MNPLKRKLHYLDYTVIVICLIKVYKQVTIALGKSLAPNKQQTTTLPNDNPFY